MKADHVHHPGDSLHSGWKGHDQYDVHRHNMDVGTAEWFEDRDVVVTLTRLQAAALEGQALSALDTLKDDPDALTALGMDMAEALALSEAHAILVKARGE